MRFARGVGEDGMYTIQQCDMDNLKMYILLETKGAFYCHVILPEDNGMDRVTTCKELAEVTPVGTQDGKEQRPAAIKSQPVPATTLRESHSSLQEKTNKGSHTLTWGTEC